MELSIQKRSLEKDERHCLISEVVNRCLAYSDEELNAFFDPSKLTLEKILLDLQNSSFNALKRTWPHFVHCTHLSKVIWNEVARALGEFKKSSLELGKDKREEPSTAIKIEKISQLYKLFQERRRNRTSQKQLGNLQKRRPTQIIEPY